MLDDVVTFLRNLGWMEHEEMNCASYDKLVVVFLSSLYVGWVGTYKGQKVLISFRMFNTNHQMSLREFNALLHLRINVDTFRDVLSWWRLDLVWLSITCSKCKTYTASLGDPESMTLDKLSPRIYAIIISVTHNV